MFDRLKSIFAVSPRKSRVDQAQSYNLDDKPFAKALVLRATTYQDEAKRDLRAMHGKLKPIAEPKTLQEMIASCAVTIVHHITHEAMKNIGRDPTFCDTLLLNNPMPKDAPLVVAFSLFVLTGLHYQLQAEGIELEFHDLAVETACLFFMFHSDEDRVKYVMQGIQAFHTVAQSGAQNVRDWHDNLMQLIPIYVMQWTTKDEKFKKVECIPLFGGLLTSLLSTVE
jgi:hypothetical protein